MIVIKGLGILQPNVMWIRVCYLTHQFHETEPLTYVLTLYLSSLKYVPHVCCVWDFQYIFSSISMHCTKHPSHLLVLVT